MANEIHKFLTDTTSLLGGLKWFCGTCIEPIEAFKAGRSLTPEKPPKNEERSTDTQNIDTPVDENFTSAQKMSICRDFRQGKCKHGITGKKQINGSACKFSHPCKCMRFCKHGRDPSRGCNQSNCDLFHPILCRYSVKRSSCLNESCTFVHLVGTKRKITRIPLLEDERPQATYSGRPSGAPQVKFSVGKSRSFQNFDNLDDPTPQSYAEATKFSGYLENDVLRTVMNRLREIQEQQTRMQADMLKLGSSNFFSNMTGPPVRQP